MVRAAGSAFRGALDLPVFEFDGRKPTENGDGNLELAAGGVDLVDAAGELTSLSAALFVDIALAEQ